MRWDAKMNITPHTSNLYVHMQTFFAVRMRKFTFRSRAQHVSLAANNRSDGNTVREVSHDAIDVMHE